MTRKRWIMWVLLVDLLWISFVFCDQHKDPVSEAKVKNTCRGKKTVNFVSDDFSAIITSNDSISCVIFFHSKNDTTQNEDAWIQKKTKEDGSHILYLPKWKNWTNFNNILIYFNTSLSYTSCDLKDNITACSKSDYKPEESDCSDLDEKNRLAVSVSLNKHVTCANCDNPVKKPKEMMVDTTISSDGGEVSAAEVANIMADMGNLISMMNDSQATVNLGDGATGVLVKKDEPEEIDEVSFAYTKPDEALSVITERKALADFSRSITVTKEAFEQAVSSNVSVPFAAVFRFLNMTKDEQNSTVLGDEVLAVEMGTTIKNLTDKININFWNLEYRGYPNCHSWDGNGSQPNWTADGCTTVIHGTNITCQCSHLTFFAVLMTPLNETISSTDLKNLTIITQVGCGLSMFFLGIVFFMHFLLSKTKATKATTLLINLMSAMFLLNLTFLINHYIAKLRSDVGCKITAASMHYFMLATFTWFAVQAFHICLQMCKGGKIEIHHYMIKVSVTSWVLPSIAAIVLLSIGKYGEQIIYTDDPDNTVAMCWITDNNIHYFINIGYYVLVFIITFTCFIVILSWLYCLRKTKADTVQVNNTSKNIVTILGLCCMLGITWGFAFFAHGPLRIPSYYIFTILNSFQGFFLFIYYYNTSHSRNANIDKGDTSSSSSTMKTTIDVFENPYQNDKK